MRFADSAPPELLHCFTDHWRAVSQNTLPSFTTWQKRVSNVWGLRHSGKAQARPDQDETRLGRWFPFDVVNVFGGRPSSVVGPRWSTAMPAMHRVAAALCLTGEVTMAARAEKGIIETKLAPGAVVVFDPASVSFYLVGVASIIAVAEIAFEVPRYLAKKDPAMIKMSAVVGALASASRSEVRNIDLRQHKRKLEGASQPGAAKRSKAQPVLGDEEIEDIYKIL